MYVQGHISDWSSRSSSSSSSSQLISYREVFISSFGMCERSAGSDEQDEDQIGFDLLKGNKCDEDQVKVGYLDKGMTGNKVMNRIIGVKSEVSSYAGAEENEIFEIPKDTDARMESNSGSHPVRKIPRINIVNKAGGDIVQRVPGGPTRALLGPLISQVE